jgi:hypothetical protein
MHTHNLIAKLLALQSHLGEKRRRERLKEKRMRLFHG